MKFEKLNQQKVRYHADMKPRLTNPTFTSSNVWGSMHMQNMQRSKSYSTISTRKEPYFAQKITQTKKLSLLNNNDNYQPQSPNKQARSHSRRSQSNLFNYGLNSLQPLGKSINGKDIYQKQAKKYNIVTIQPKEYVDTINLFPKLRLQNSDQNLNKRLTLEKSMFQSRASFPQNQKTQNILNKKLASNPQQQYVI